MHGCGHQIHGYQAAACTDCQLGKHATPGSWTALASLTAGLEWPGMAGGVLAAWPSNGSPGSSGGRDAIPEPRALPPEAL